VCEILAVQFPRARPFASLLGPVLRIEEYGITGFGWGVAWEESGSIRCVKNERTLSDDPTSQSVLRSVSSDRFLVHLRRPSLLSTISLEDTQPFVSEDRSRAFAHNGRLAKAQAVRHCYADGLRGRGDSEVGFRICESKCAAGVLPGSALQAVHDELGGTANMGLMPAVGPMLVYAGNPLNPVWTFDLEEGRAAATCLHSADDSLFRLCFPAATRRVALGDREVVSLGSQLPSSGYVRS
jgi:glutamine phosphoribosylpyrophosphate amidotransferase